MLYARPEQPGAWLLGSLLFIPFLLFGLGFLNLPLFIGGLIFTVFFLLLVINFEAGFLALVFIRSSLDYLRNFSAGGMNIAALVSVLLIILGIFYTLYQRVNVLKFEDAPAFLIFIAVCGVSLTNSPNLQETLSDWLRLLSVFSVYLLARMIFITEEKIKLAFSVVLLSSLFPILAGLLQLVTGQGMIDDGGQARIVGTFLHPNAFASYLLIILIFSMAQLLERENFVDFHLLIPVMTGAFTMFLFTFSRGAWIVFILTTVFMGFLRYRRLLGCLPLILCLSLLTVPGIQDRIMNIFNPSPYARGRSGWDWRMDTWAEISPRIAEKPVLGHGLSTVELEYGILTHNDYLRLLVETGIIGFSAYLLLMAVVFFNTLKAYRRNSSPLAKSFQVGLLALLLGFLVRQFADNTLRNTVVMVYFWIFVALTRNISLLQGEKAHETSDRQ